MVDLSGWMDEYYQKKMENPDETLILILQFKKSQDISTISPSTMLKCCGNYYSITPYADAL